MKDWAAPFKETAADMKAARAVLEGDFCDWYFWNSRLRITNTALVYSLFLTCVIILRHEIVVVFLSISLK